MVCLFMIVYVCFSKKSIYSLLILFATQEFTRE